MKKETRNRCIGAGAAVVLFVVACVLLRPWYLHYVENDHMETCIKARFVLVDRYNHKVDALLDAGQDRESIDYDAIFLECMEENFPDAFLTDGTGFLQGADPAESGGEEDAAGKLYAQADPEELTTPSAPERIYVASGICRSGGTYTIAMDPISHKLDIWCDYTDGDEFVHGDYNWGYGLFGE